MKAVLFDLDGTLVDSAADLLGTLDDVRAECGLSPCAASLPAAVAARGGRGILSLGFPDAPEQVERLLPRYLQLYAGRIARASRPYPGVLELLDGLAVRGIALAIVSNKPVALARQLLAELGMSGRFAVVLGGDSLPVRKPAPDPLWHACGALGVAPAATVMVGDDARDIAAGRAAGCGYTIAAAYGYVEDHAALDAWGANHIAHSVQALGEVLRRLPC